MQKKKWKRLFPIITLSVHGSLNTSFFLSIFFWKCGIENQSPWSDRKKISHYWISFSKEIGLFLSIKIQVHSFPYSIHSAISWVAKHLRCTTTLKLDWKEEKFTKNKFKSVKRIYQYQFWAYVSMNAYGSTFDEKYWKELFKSI